MKIISKRDSIDSSNDFETTTWNLDVGNFKTAPWKYLLIDLKKKVKIHFLSTWGSNLECYLQLINDKTYMYRYS